MKKCSIMLLILLFPAQVGLVAGGPTIKYIPVNQDKTLTLEQYYSFGIPRTISDPDDIKTVNRKLLTILKNNPEELPRYNSKKSGPLFHMFASFHGIRRILSSLKTDREQQAFLKNYTSIGFQPARVYASASSYSQEYLLASSTALYADLLSIQLLEKHLPASKLSNFDQYQRRTMTKTVGLHYALLVKLNQAESVDPYVRETVKTRLALMKRMIKRSKLIDRRIVFELKKCLGI